MSVLEQWDSAAWSADDGITGNAPPAQPVPSQMDSGGDVISVLDWPGFHALASAAFQDLAASEVDEVFVACCEHERKERLREHEAKWQTRSS